MRKYLISAVSLAALTLGGASFAQTTTDQPVQTPSQVDCAANPADPACDTTMQQKTDPNAATTGDAAQKPADPSADTGSTATTTTPDTTKTDSGTAQTTPPADTGTTADTATPPADTGTTATTTPSTDTGTTATTTPSTDTGTAAGSATMSGDEILATSFIGKTVYTSARENVGDINDLVMSKDGDVKAAVIGVGGFLGMGEKDVMIPLDKITVSKDENGNDFLTIGMTKAELESAPAFDRTAMMSPPAAPAQ
jgi:sporulation protein YlmC with PRC-barrel domain